MSALDRLSLDELMALRDEYGAGWDRQYAAGNLDACESIMDLIRRASAEIAKRVTA